jgi:hypothetical protein
LLSCAFIIIGAFGEKVGDVLGQHLLLLWVLASSSFPGCSLTAFYQVVIDERRQFTGNRRQNNVK